MSSSLLQLSPDRLAPLGSHNRFQQVDRLYDPLRHSFDPMQPHAVSGQSAIRSHVSHSRVQLTPQKMAELKEATLIPSQDRLVPTHDLSLVAGTHLVAIDSTEKVGAPLSPEQLHERIRHRQADEVVVYQLGEQRPVPPPITEPPIVIQRPLGVNEYRMPTMKETVPRTTRPYRYNLYSMIDEPVNRLMETPGCNLFGVCTRCAPNEIIASRNQVRNNWLR